MNWIHFKHRAVPMTLENEAAYAAERKAMSESKDPMTPHERTTFSIAMQLLAANRPKGFNTPLIHAGNVIGVKLAIVHATVRLYAVATIVPESLDADYCPDGNRIITAPTTSKSCRIIVDAIKGMEAICVAVKNRADSDADAREIDRRIANLKPIA